MSEAHRYDVALLSDFRYSGGTSASVAEEVRAQAAAGLTTVLVHVPAAHLRSARAFNPRIVDCLRGGYADLALPGEPVSARLLVMRQPRVFAADRGPAPRVDADRAVMVVNQGPCDQSGARVYYDLSGVRQRVESLVGEAVWAPIGPLVRAQVRATDPAFPLAATDWHNIIDVAQWWRPRPAPVADVPVIGRHSRPDPKKWPRTAEDILAAYPATGDVRVRVLGGGEEAVARLGARPASWEILPFGSRHPREFLHTIDYFVYFHDPDWVEAFGRTILEAMASGAPAILPETFRPLFGDAAIYATPSEVAGIVKALHADWDRYREVSERARGFVERRFGYASHLARLAELGVQPTARPGNRAPARARRPLPAGPPRPASTSPPARVLLVSSNGAGLGHLTRLMAIARRLPAGVQPVFATQSMAAPLVREAGYLTEYLPSRTYLDIPADRWNHLLYERLLDLLAVHRPRAVAVDGTVPYSGMLRAMARHPEVTWVWVRRAMWRRGQGGQWIQRGRAYHHVLEPGEVAEAADQGPTVPERAAAKRVAPITYLDRAELLDRDAARRELGLGAGPAALLQLGAGNINDIGSPAARLAGELAGHGFRVVLAQSPIATHPLVPPLGVTVVSQYPLSRFLRGFDLVVSAAGYNAFHELVAFGVPAVVVPNTETDLDDQLARARHAEQEGIALALLDPCGDDAPRVLAQAARPEVRAALARRCDERAVGNGATEAARWLAALGRG